MHPGESLHEVQSNQRNPNICNVTRKGFSLFLNYITEHGLQKAFLSLLTLASSYKNKKIIIKKNSIISEEIIYIEKCPGVSIILLPSFQVVQRCFSEETEMWFKVLAKMNVCTMDDNVCRGFA